MKLSYLPLALALTTLSAHAQEAPSEAPTETPVETPTETPAEEQPTEAPSADDTLPLGEPAPAEEQIGAPYVLETHGDWQIRCIKTPNGLDPCQLYQRLLSPDQTPIAEFTVFPLLEPQGEAVAAGSVSAPLETLLTAMATLRVDGNDGKRYPFRYCTQVGCYASLGFADSDIASLKNGAKATLTVVPVLAPDEQINIEISLSGFTAGYNSLKTILEDLEVKVREAEAAAAEETEDGN